MKPRSLLCVGAILALGHALDVRADVWLEDCDPDSSDCCLVETPSQAPCTSLAELATFDPPILFYTYVDPDTTHASHYDLEYVYTNGIVAQYGGASNVISRLVDLSHILCTEHDNVLDAAASDIALMFNMSHVTAYHPYPYGDSNHYPPGSNFSLDQRVRYDNENGIPWPNQDSQVPAVPDISKVDHLDIIIITEDEAETLRALGCDSALPNSTPHELHLVEGFPSDLGENPPTVGGANGVIIVGGIPHNDNVAKLNSLYHELGHVLESLAIHRTWGHGILWSLNPEALPEFTRAVAALPILDPENLPASGVPYGATYLFGSIEDDINGISVRYLERMWLSYLAEHFHQNTPSVEDDLLHDYYTREKYEPNNFRWANMYMAGLASILDDAVYEDVQVYPYLGGIATDGERKVAQIFTNYAVALAVNAPELSVGEFGFQRFSPTRNVPLFQLTAWSTQRATFPPDITVLDADYGLTRIVQNPFEYPNGAPQELQLFSWSVDYLIFRIDSQAVGTLPRELHIDIKGKDTLFVDPSTGLEHSVQGAAILMGDLGGQWIHESPEKVLDVWQMGSFEGGTCPGGPCVNLAVDVPLYTGVRNVVLVLTLSERNMPERLDDHPLRGAPETPWKYDVEYKLRDVVPPASAVTLDNTLSATDLDYEGQPYSSVTLNYNGDAFEDLFACVAFGSGQEVSSLHQGVAVNNGVPEFQKTVTVFAPGSEPLFQRGASVADYDNDGDMDLFAGGSFNPHLYRNDGGTFSDQVSLLGYYPDVEHSWAGSWGDFDRDGYLDLFVGRGESSVEPTTTAAEFPNYLFRNETGSGGGFVNVSVSANVDQDPLQQDCTLGAAWADFDADGDLDLFTTRIMEDGSPNGPYQGSLLYVNQDDGTFVESSDSVFDENIVYVSGAAWADLDENGELDLIVSGQNAPNLGGLRVYTQDAGSLSLASPDMGLDLDWDASGVFVLDHDLDGTADLLGIPFDPGTPPPLYAGFRAGSTIVWADQSANVGLEAAKTGGAVVRDFNGDGDLDVFLGRRTSTNKYFYRALWGGVDAPTNNYIAIQLRAAEDDSVTWDGGNNYNGVGATLTLAMPAANPVVTQTRVIDGGSSRGGQGPSTIVFGLGSYTDALLTVAWPDGSNQTRTINSGEINNGGAPLVVFDTHMPALNQPSVSASIELLPNLNINWVFTWETGNSTDPKKDTVKVQTYDPGGKYIPPPQCIMNPVTLRYDTNNVVHTYVAKQGGGYIHTLRYENRPCNAPCTFEYQVTSALSTSRSAQSPWKQFTVPVCVQ